MPVPVTAPVAEAVGKLANVLVVRVIFWMPSAPPKSCVTEAPRLNVII